MQPNQNELLGIPADANKRKFTGIWIPAEVWLDEKIPPLARVLYGEIASYGKSGCWVKTEELREPLGVSAKTFQKFCKQLKDSGYIIEQRRFGRIVRTTTLGFQSSKQILHQSKNCRDERGKIYRDEQGNDYAVQLEYTKNIQKNIHKGADAPADEQKENQKEPEQPKQYGNAKVNEFLETWLSETGDDFSKTQRERRAAHNLIQSNEPEALRALLTAVGEARRSGDRFAPQIAAPSDLVGKYSKLNKLRMWVARQQANESSGEEPFIPDFDGSKPAYWFYPEPTDEERAKVKKMANEMRKSGKYSWLKPKGEGNESR